MRTFVNYSIWAVALVTCVSLTTVSSQSHMSHRLPPGLRLRRQHTAYPPHHGPPKQFYHSKPSYVPQKLRYGQPFPHTYRLNMGHPVQRFPPQKPFYNQRPNFGAPKNPQYRPATPGNGAPVFNYPPHKPSYSAQKPIYGSPKQLYGVSKPTYGTPSAPLSFHGPQTNAYDGSPNAKRLNSYEVPANSISSTYGTSKPAFASPQHAESVYGSPKPSFASLPSFQQSDIAYGSPKPNYGSQQNYDSAEILYGSKKPFSPSLPNNYESAEVTYGAQKPQNAYSSPASNSFETHKPSNQHQSPESSYEGSTFTQGSSNGIYGDSSSISSTYTAAKILTKNPEDATINKPVRSLSYELPVSTSYNNYPSKPKNHKETHGNHFNRPTKAFPFEIINQASKLNEFGTLHKKPQSIIHHQKPQSNTHAGPFSFFNSNYPFNLQGDASNTDYNSYKPISAPNYNKPPHSKPNSNSNSPFEAYNSVRGSVIDANSGQATSYSTYDTLSGALKESFGNVVSPKGVDSDKAASVHVINHSTSNSADSTSSSNSGNDGSPVFQAPIQTFRFTPSQEQEQEQKARVKYTAPVKYAEPETKAPQDYHKGLEVSATYETASETLSPNYFGAFGDKINAKIPVKENAEKKQRNRVQYRNQERYGDDSPVYNHQDTAQDKSSNNQQDDAEDKTYSIQPEVNVTSEAQTVTTETQS